MKQTTKFYLVKICFYAEITQKRVKNQDKPTKVAKTIVKYHFNNLIQVSGDYGGGPPPPRDCRGGVPPSSLQKLGLNSLNCILQWFLQLYLVYLGFLKVFA